MKKLKKILDAWCDGLKYKSVKTPPLETIYELIEFIMALAKPQSIQKLYPSCHFVESSTE